MPFMLAETHHQSAMDWAFRVLGVLFLLASIVIEYRYLVHFLSRIPAKRLLQAVMVANVLSYSVWFVWIGLNC